MRSQYRSFESHHSMLSRDGSSWAHEHTDICLEEYRAREKNAVQGSRNLGSRRDRLGVTLLEGDNSRFLLLDIAQLIDAGQQACL